MPLEKYILRHTERKRERERERDRESKGSGKALGLLQPSTLRSW